MPHPDHTEIEAAHERHGHVAVTRGFTAVGDRDGDAAAVVGPLQHGPMLRWRTDRAPRRRHQRLEVHHERGALGGIGHRDPLQLHGAADQTEVDRAGAGSEPFVGALAERMRHRGLAEHREQPQCLRALLGEAPHALHEAAAAVRRIDHRFPQFAGGAGRDAQLAEATHVEGVVPHDLTVRRGGHDRQHVAGAVELPDPFRDVQVVGVTEAVGAVDGARDLGPVIGAVGARHAHDVLLRRGERRVVGERDQ